MQAIFCFFPGCGDSTLGVSHIRSWVAGYFAWLVNPDLVGATAIVYVTAMMLNYHYIPYTRRESLVNVASGLTIIAAISIVMPERALILFELAVVLLCAAGIGVVTTARKQRDARREYLRLRRVVPSQIIRQGTDFEDANLFRAANRSCICIASDWRGYQKMSADRTPDEIADWLQNYYEMCEMQLENHFPDGNYFSDWIADELFIVIFRENGSVAASVGEALIGLLGPKSHAKTTALGEVAGHARRIQTLGKLIRSRYGEEDRILFTDPRFAEAVMHRNVSEFVSDHPLRDLSEQKFYYYEVSEKAFDFVA